MNSTRSSGAFSIASVTGTTLRQITACLLAVLVSCPPAQSQQGSKAARPSDLASENLNRVAASAAQIQEVLRRDPGLLVELTRWVAKEATDHGQIVEDSDLAEQGIFTRLASDIAFRAVATRLVQRYGYLMPKLNPESEAAKEQELLLRERTRRLARTEAEDEDRLDRRGSERELERTGGCDPRRDRECDEEQRRPRERQQEQTRAAETSPRADAEELREQTSPRQGSGNPLGEPEIRSRYLLQTAGEISPGLAQRPAQRLNESFSSASGLEVAPAETRADRAGGTEDREASASLVPDRTPHRRSRSLPAAREEREIKPGTAAMVRRANPYADIPSLFDMYLQASARPPALERFGLEIFRNGTRDSDLIPMDLPVGPDYTVGPGDGLAIDLWGGVSQRLYRVVDREGRLSLPEVGPVLVSGRTMSEVQQAVQQLMRTQFRDVSADVSLSRLRTIRVYVVGEVEQPGAYDISSLSTPLNALFAAGGPTERGSLRPLKHLRGKELVQEVDVYDLLVRGVRSDLKRLESGDTLLIPPIGAQVTVEGMVRRPAIYELRGEKTLAEMLELAGGILPTATLRHIEVQRVEAHQKRTMLSLDITENADAGAARKQLESFAIRDGDNVHIFPIAPYNQDAVFLQGHVLRPGRYSYRPDMKLTDLISSYADLLPEPAPGYAEIVRLNPPDFRPSVESFELAAVLTHPAAAPKLQPLDTVRIFSRYDFENPPTVWVSGEVRNPGPFLTTGQVHLRDALQLAGGVTLDALLESAQVYRYLPDSRLKILNVNLEQALAGNPIDNLLLQPRDRILVHRNPARVDPPSVFVRGEVAKPGRYPLTTNLRVEDLIRLAGGLKRSAFPESADLVRYSPQASGPQSGESREIKIAAALAGDLDHDLLLRDGDVLTIRQLPGWNEIGAAVTLQGDIEHPGAYGIRPGERLSSVLKRAGGFRTTAYPQAAVFERAEVRQLQAKSRQELIQRVEQEAATVKVALSEGAKEQAELQQAAVQQRQRVLESLRSAQVTGRLVIRLPRDLSGFENSADNIEVRAGDTLYIPKRPDFVVVTGQVYNSNATAYVPRKTAAWYLERAGGSTDLAEKKAIFIVRANGSVVSGRGGGWWGGNAMSARIDPGDIIVVPEHAIGKSTLWKNLLGLAQMAQAASLSAFVATR